MFWSLLLWMTGSSHPALQFVELDKVSFSLLDADTARTDVMLRPVNAALQAFPHRIDVDAR
jgi:hypothetical protein